MLPDLPCHSFANTFYTSLPAKLVMKLADSLDEPVLFMMIQYIGQIALSAS